MLKKIFYIIVVPILIVSCSFSRNGNETAKIIFVGDLLLDRGVRDRIEYLGMNSLFHRSIDSIFDNANVVIANLECPATEIIEPINKKYIFRAEPIWLDALKDHGITHLTMANNHSMDQGRRGLIDTKENIEKRDLIPLGFGEDHRKACQPKLVMSYPRKVYVLSSVQVPSENWTFLEEKPCVCEESFDAIAKRIKKLKDDEPNSFVIVQLHWGAEHTLKPLISQKQQAYELIDSGADGIIGHHTHTTQTIELYREKPIYYSIGNFIFDQSNPINTNGLLVSIEVNKSEVTFKEIKINIEKCVPRF